ncbi:hypothetical protein D0867_05381, partial [Hortaea werneckii]
MDLGALQTRQNDLPDELWLLITEYLAAKDVWASVRHVNERLSRIATDQLMRADHVRRLSIGVSFSLGSGSHHRWFDIRGTITFSFQHFKEHNSRYAIFGSLLVHPQESYAVAMRKWETICSKGIRAGEQWKVQEGVHGEVKVVRLQNLVVVGPGHELEQKSKKRDIETAGVCEASLLLLEACSSSFTKLLPKNIDWGAFTGLHAHTFTWTLSSSTDDNPLGTSYWLFVRLGRCCGIAIMDDVNEAKELIEKIRRARRVDESGEEDANAADLSNALRMQVPPHVAHVLTLTPHDDNKYAPDVLPKLQIVYREDGLLFIGCNEVGFTAANVQAICRIACSTKKAEGSQKGYIGEKGIGFKAVFKVADIVWIKSGALSFAFDKTKPLGMIAPKWTDFPDGGNMNERIMFCFRIPEQEHRDIVAAHLQELKPELLIFLRQLRRVEVTLQDKAGKVKRTFSLAREDKQVSDVRLTTLRHIVNHPKAATNEEQFLVFCDTKTGMPREKKRENVTESDVLMAFPPIRSYGLPFVLQGDFMLSASREDILQQNKWNDAVVDATVTLFAKCVDAFNTKDLLKHAWPRYAKSQGNAHGTIFQGFFKRLCAHLRSRKVLQSQAGSLEMPSGLSIVPLDYMDGPKPLVVAPGRLRTYLSPTYRTNDLSDLQISTLGPREFFRIVSRYAEFSEQPEAWHVKLAKALLRAGSHYAHGMPLIPMSDGKWIVPDEGTFYFPEVAEGMSIPNGIEVAMISSEVKDPERRTLFTELGASKLRINEVFELILNQHKKASHSNKAWSCEQAVEHARFLYSAPSRPRSYTFKDFRLYGSDNKLHVAEDLYMDDPKSTTTISTLFGKSNARIVFIHPRYFDPSVTEVSSGWFNWLKNEVEVNTLPRLTRPGYHVSPEFHWLIDHKASSVWLSLLKD